MLLKNKDWKPIRISVDANTVLMKLEEAREIALRVAYLPYSDGDGNGHIRRRIAGLISELAVASYFKTVPKDIGTNNGLILKAPDMMFFKKPSFFEIKTSSQFNNEHKGAHFLKNSNKDIPYIFCNVDFREFEINPFRELEGITVGEKIESETKYFKEMVLMGSSNSAYVDLLGIATPKIVRKYSCPMNSTAATYQKKVIFLTSGLEDLLPIPKTLEELNEVGYEMAGVNFKKIDGFIEDILPYYDKVGEIRKELIKRELI